MDFTKFSLGCYYDATINVFGSKLFGKWKYPLLDTVKQRSTCVTE